MANGFCYGSNPAMISAENLPEWIVKMLADLERIREVERRTEDHEKRIGKLENDSRTAERSRNLWGR